MTSEEYLKLYQKFIEGKCDAEEARRLLDYEDAFKMVEDTERSSDEALKARIKAHIDLEIAQKPSALLRKWYTYAAAAAIIVILGTALIFNQTGPSIWNEAEKSASGYKKVVSPMQANAPILTLADGSTIALNKKGAGLLINEAGTEIKKLNDGELSYTFNESAINKNIALNKIYIPNGNTFKITLSDGTKVWLNAATTLTYPSAFNGSERVVSLSGEAYFEVAKNAKKPFKVKVNNTEVKVLGTHFNVSAYPDDDQMSTSLLEGSVQIAHLGGYRLLVPGQQAITKAGSANIQLQKMSVQQVMAWKDGYFLFRDNSITEVMTQVARWYNLQVVYQDKIEGKHFGGIYDKSKNLEELLNGLELTGLVKFKIVNGNSAEERRVVVME